jgi:hypothetical protein
MMKNRIQPQFVFTATSNPSQINSATRLAIGCTSFFATLGLNAEFNSAHAQAPDPNLKKTAETTCIQAATAKGFTLQNIVSSQVTSANSVTVVLNLTREGQAFRLTCGHTPKTATTPSATTPSATTPSATTPSAATPSATQNQASAETQKEAVGSMESASSDPGKMGSAQSKAGEMGSIKTSTGNMGSAVTTPDRTDANASGAATAPQSTAPQSTAPQSTAPQSTNPGQAGQPAAQPETGQSASQTTALVTGDTASPEADWTKLAWLLLPLLGLPLLLAWGRDRKAASEFGHELNATVHTEATEVDIHAAPGTHQPVIGQLHSLQQVKLTGRYQEQWAELASGGWVPTQYLQTPVVSRQLVS